MDQPQEVLLETKFRIDARVVSRTAGGLHTVERNDSTEIIGGYSSIEAEAVANRLVAKLKQRAEKNGEAVLMPRISVSLKAPPS